MTATTADLALRVKTALLAEAESDLSPSDLADDTPLNAPGFRLDSMAFLRAVMAVEDELGIRVDEQALGAKRLVTVGDVVAWVAGSVERS